MYQKRFRCFIFCAIHIWQHFCIKMFFFYVLCIVISCLKMWILVYKSSNQLFLSDFRISWCTLLTKVLQQRMYSVDLGIQMIQDVLSNASMRASKSFMQTTAFTLWLQLSRYNYKYIIMMHYTTLINRMNLFW